MRNIRKEAMKCGKNNGFIENSHDEIGQNSLNITGKFTPYWQYKTETFRMSFSPDFIWERFTYPQKTSTLPYHPTFTYIRNWISVES